MRTVRLAVRVGVFAAVCATSACSPPAATARHTVSEYRADASLRHRQIEGCANDPGTLALTPDCVNAREASQFEDTRRLRDLPPISLPSNGKPYAKNAQGH